MAIGRIPEPLAGIQESIIAAKGDLIVGTANDQAGILSVGTNGHTLVADSSTATGLKWAAPSSGALVLIRRTSYSNVVSQAFDDVFTTSYQTYMVIIENHYAATGGDNMQIQLRYAGPTTQTTAYYGPSFYLAYNGSLTTANINNLSAAEIALYSGSSADPATGQLFFSNVGNTTEYPHIYAQTMNPATTALQFTYCYSSTQRNYTGFLIKSESSNVTGTIAVYGLATA